MLTGLINCSFVLEIFHFIHFELFKFILQFFHFVLCTILYISKLLLKKLPRYSLRHVQSFGAQGTSFSSPQAKIPFLLDVHSPHPKTSGNIFIKLQYLFVELIFYCSETLPFLFRLRPSFQPFHTFF